MIHDRHVDSITLSQTNRRLICPGIARTHQVHLPRYLGSIRGEEDSSSLSGWRSKPVKAPGTICELDWGSTSREHCIQCPDDVRFNKSNLYFCWVIFILLPAYLNEISSKSKRNNNNNNNNDQDTGIKPFLIPLLLLLLSLGVQYSQCHYYHYYHYYYHYYNYHHCFNYS